MRRGSSSAVLRAATAWSSTSPPIGARSAGAASGNTRPNRFVAWRFGTNEGVPLESALTQIEHGVRHCRLQRLETGIAICTGLGCPFWEAGGAVLAGGCVLERLVPDLEARPELVPALLQVRRKLEQALSQEDEDEARSLLYQLVPAARGDHP